MFEDEDTGSFGASGGAATLDRDELESLDEADRARLLPGLLGVKTGAGPLHYIPRSRDGRAPAWVFDEDSGMVWILD